ncbi:MAG: 2-oxo acid dehydrogenase subunit E2 [Chloroflexi bacterium]|nr:2-oxo acid dehydrogenase subunit E2 [Chloroflexota bacterium]
MATEVLIPKLGMTMTEGTVAAWHVPDGGAVRAGDPIYRLETEKIEFEVEAEQDGIVRHVAPEGATLECGLVVGYVLAPGEPMPSGSGAPAPVRASTNGAAAAVTTTPPPAPAAAAAGEVIASPVARRLAKEHGLDLAGIPGTGPGGRITEADVEAALARPAPLPAAAPTTPGREVIASPLARKLAESLGVDLAVITGTGPGGRITKEDVEAAVGHGAPAPAAPATPAGSVGEIRPIRGIRKVIFERMHASLQEMAQLTLGVDVWMEDAVKLRAQLIDEWAADGVRPSHTDLVIKAVAKALRSHPRLNAEVRADGIHLLPGVHIGLAVALDDGLVVPVIRDADTLSLKEIAAESSRLAAAARANRLTLDEMAGGTFSVTALGMFGVDFFTPIINPPNVAILGVGRIHDGVAWDGDRPVRRQQMTLSLTWDHRAVDGAPAAEFVQAVKALLEAPYRLLL